MKLLRICYWFLLFPLLGINSCTKSVFPPKPPMVHPVTINNCKVTPKWFPANDSDSVTWTVTVTDANAYSIDFNNKTPLTPPLTLIPTITSHQPVSKTVSGDSSCQKGIPISTGDCYFEYRVYQYQGVNKTLCGDPGIHMVN